MLRQKLSIPRLCPLHRCPGRLDAWTPEQFQQVMHALHDAVYTVNRDGRITYANTAFARLTRYAVEELLGSLSTQFYVSEDTALFLERRQQALQGEPVSPRLETEIRCKDGTRVPVELSVTNLVQEGQIIGRVAVARDISERKRLEERLHQAQKMEALGTLAGGIAHHFNNIFAVIMGYAEMALDEVPQDSQLWSNLQEVRTAGYRAADLVRHLLTLSRQRIWARQPLPLHLAVQEALTMLRVSLPATIEMRQQLREDAGSVLADPVAIRQILLHLGTNAVQAMRDTGGVLEIRLDAVHIDAAFAAAHPELRPGPHVRLTVRDTDTAYPLR